MDRVHAAHVGARWPTPRSALRGDARSALDALLARDRSIEPLAPEIHRMREQLSAIARFAARRC